VRAQTLEVEFGHRSDTTVDIHFHITARIESAEETEFDWILQVRIQGLGSRVHTLPNGSRYAIPHNTNHELVVTNTQRPEGLSDGEVWRTDWTATVPKRNVLVEDNDQYLFWAQLVPDVHITPSREIFASVREDID
jgi:hypothetical protein